MENISPEAAYLTNGRNIVYQEHTVMDALTPAAKTQATATATLHAAADEVLGRARLNDPPGAVTHTAGSIKTGF